jgi:hypothetical protein
MSTALRRLSPMALFSRNPSSVPLIDFVWAPEPGQVAGEAAVRPVRWLAGPHPVGELAGRHRVVDIGEQGGQDTALPRVTEIDGPAVDAGFDVPEQTESDWHGAGPPRDRGSSEGSGGPSAVRPKRADRA